MKLVCNSYAKDAQGLSPANYFTSFLNLANVKHWRIPDRHLLKTNKKLRIIEFCSKRNFCLLDRNPRPADISFNIPQL